MHVVKTTTTPTVDVQGTREVALKAMHDRGVTNPEHFLQYAEPKAILGACRWFDAKTDATPGLLVWKIKQGGELAPAAKTVNGSSSRNAVAYDTSGLPLFFMAHSAWDERRDYFVTCPEGSLLLVEAVWPVCTVECDACGFLGGLPHRDLSARLRSQLGVFDGLEAE